MSLGRSSSQPKLFDGVAEFCGSSLQKDSIYSFLHRERDRLFPDEFFGDLYSRRGRRSVPPSILATVMVLQRLEGLSDYEAVERFSYDARWRYATGVGGYGGGGLESFDRTVLVYTRERLRHSQDPDRIFRAVLEAGKEAGLVGRKRVLDSTALYDAVSTMDTITLIRSAIRLVLRSLDEELCARVRSVFTSDDAYATSAKPQIDWSDDEARVTLIDSRARDGYACLEVLEGLELTSEQHQAVELLATVVGQDLEVDEEGRHTIVRGVARDRVISTVDPETRHGHKTSARGFDGYKGHIAVDPDSELITATQVTPGNAADGVAAKELVKDLLESEPGEREGSQEERAASKAEVYGDSAYGTAEFQSLLAEEEIDSYCKTPAPSSRAGTFGKDAFVIDLTTRTVTCPAGITISIPESEASSVQVSFGRSCAECELRGLCTKSKTGRHIRVSQDEAILVRSRQRQKDQTWLDRYRSTRPIVERKFAHCMRRRHGGRVSRVRGTQKIAADFSLLAAATNLARLALLGIQHGRQGWRLSTN